MLKYFVDGTEPRIIFNMKILITRINLAINEFFFITLGDDAVQARTSNLAFLVLFRCISINSSSNNSA